ncbi:hypothetical protein FQN50_001587 [Emmonsiellopsis sp. PD_5]|nr:hypothetical protein FQN50_001587 [Emmonsiellopsis sp. PD_5]
MRENVAVAETTHTTLSTVLNAALAAENAEDSEKRTPHIFNEQTNYVPKRTIITLLYGRISDIWSRKVILFIGLAIFFIGSLAASLAQSATQLIIFRAFTGVGGGGLMTVAQMIVSDVVPLRERGKYQGILGSVVAIAHGIGPVIGGSLASMSKDSWRDQVRFAAIANHTSSDTFSGLIVHWVGRYRECILFGWVVWAVGLGLFSTLDQSSGLGKQIGYGILTGLGVGNTLQPALIAVQAGVERRDMAVVTSFRNFVRNLGGTLGIGVAGTIIHNTLLSSLSVLNLSKSDTTALLRSPETYLSTLSELEATRIRSVLIPAYQTGFRIIFIIGAGLAAFAFVLSVFFMPQVALNRADDEALKAEGRKRIQGRSSSGEENA